MKDDSGQEQDSKPWQSSLHEASRYMTIGIQLAGTMLVYVIGGYLLDRWLETEPWLLILGAVIGMIAFFVQIVKLSRDLSEADRRKRASKDRPPEG